MTTAHSYPFSPIVQRRLVLVALLMFGVGVAESQTVAAAGSAGDVMSSLPDAPSSSSDRGAEFAAAGLGQPEFAEADASDTTPGARSRHRRHLASRTDITIEPGQVAPRLTAQDKVSIGLKQSFTLFSAVGWIASAGFSQMSNGSPNYGTDKGAFGERLGATALRSTTQNIFSNAVFAPIFHDDPRYYKMGRSHKFIDRVVHSVFQPLVGRSDDGRRRPNYSVLSGNLAGAILTNAYYPKPNRGVTQTMETFGTSMGGASIGYVVTEFMDDALDLVHLKKLETDSTP